MWEKRIKITADAVRWVLLVVSSTEKEKKKSVKSVLGRDWKRMTYAVTGCVSVSDVGAGSCRGTFSFSLVCSCSVGFSACAGEVVFD